MLLRCSHSDLVSPLLIETDSLFQAFMTALLRLSRATSLQSIHLTFSKIIDMKPVPHVEELFTYPITFQQRLLAVLARSAPLTLTSLVLENITPIPHSVYQSQNFANVMEQLTTFSLSTASRSKKGSSLLFSNAFADFWYTTVPSMLCRAKNLESLTLESGGCEEGFVPIEVGIRCLWLPRLKTLNLHNISFGLGLKSMSECRLEDFILRHSSTLEHLDLHGCFLWVMGHSPRITWGAMFDRFAENLPSLKRFIVFRSGVGGVIDVDAPLMQKYGSFGYSKDNVPPYVAQDDAAALQRLVAVSRARAETRVHSL
ncbi:hypothetical protein NEOLEDRAFT_304412 [Neolentinus lepideus HHB14362 ss-1]|uniref:F-box domain-containing protein n=1 Tax=Neolentinus lepideus HHB14362 ss-1 TaxID=1314782 RepID=A0A165VR82_9AGAM|nr:hypothetical protein NEOLEDRAFT_304412 [Neolentinus lepideus HHB14362 ss-1]